MFPLGFLRRRTYERRYKAALFVMVGGIAMPLLADDDRRRVEAAVDDAMRSVCPPAVFRRKGAYPAALNAARAAAMERLGIPPPVAGLSWAPLVRPWIRFGREPWSPVLRGFDPLPGRVIRDYRVMHPATADAVQFLRDHGVDATDADVPVPNGGSVLQQL